MFGGRTANLAHNSLPSLLSPHGWRSLPLLAVLLATVFLAARINKGIYVGDEGVACMSAWRIAQGQTPVADFFELETPLAAYTLAGVFGVLGPSVLASRLLGFVYGVLLIALMWWLSGLFLRRPGPRAFALALLIPFGVGAWPLPSHHWAADLCLMGALGLLARGMDDSSPAWPLLGGACTAAGALCLQDQGGYAVILIGLFVLPSLPKGIRSRFSLAWLAGLSAVALAMLGTLLHGGATISGMIRDWVVFPATQYGGGQGSMWEAAGGWREVLHGLSAGQFKAAPLYLPLTLLTYGILFLLPLGAVAAGVACIRGRWFGLPKSLLLAAVGLAFLGCALHRWALMNLTWASPALGLLVAVALDRLWDHRLPQVRAVARWGTGACLTVLMAFGGVGVFRQSLAESFDIESPSGVLHTFNPSQARALQAFVDAIGVQVPAGAPAFSWGYIPMVSFMTGHPNPTRYDTFVTSPPYNSPGQARDWMRTLEEKQVGWGFSHALPISKNDPVAPFLATHFRVVWTNGDYTLWQRNP
jgi:hypothetical protein